MVNLNPDPDHHLYTGSWTLRLALALAWASPPVRSAYSDGHPTAYEGTRLSATALTSRRRGGRCVDLEVRGVQRRRQAPVEAVSCGGVGNM